MEEGNVRGDIPGSRSRDIGYGFVDLERPDKKEQSNYGLRDWPVASA